MAAQRKHFGTTRSVPYTDLATSGPGRQSRAVGAPGKALNGTLMRHGEQLLPRRDMPHQKFETAEVAGCHSLPVRTERDRKEIRCGGLCESARMVGARSRDCR